MGNIRMELEKLITYTMGQDIVTREDIEEICTTRTENKSSIWFVHVDGSEIRGEHWICIMIF